MDVEVGQIWQDKKGVLFEVTGITTLMIDGFGMCDLVSASGEKRKGVGFGILRRHYEFIAGSRFQSGYAKYSVERGGNNCPPRSWLTEIKRQSGPLGGKSADKATGIKADSNKRRYSLLPTGTINEVVDVLEFGSAKYADDNWQKVDNARTRYYNAALRHVDAWWNGEVKDDETGKHHLAHAICCLMFLMWFDLPAHNNTEKGK